MTTDDAPQSTLQDPDGDQPAGTPRWVKVFGSVLIILMILFLIMMLTGGPGRHGPRRHAGEATSPAASHPLPAPPALATVGGMGRRAARP